MQFMMSEREPRRQEPGAREHCTLRTQSPLQPHLRRVVHGGAAVGGRTPRALLLDSELNVQLFSRGQGSRFVLLLTSH